MAEPEHITQPNGTQEWRLNGQLHRLDGPACIWSDGTQEWYVEGRPHRLDGPAIIRADGYEAWYVEDRRHRLDGPARIDADGYQEWWVHGEYIPFDIVAFFKDMGVEDADDETKLAVLKMKVAGQ